MFQSQNRLVATLIGAVFALIMVASASADGIRHTVVAGDTLSGIAYLYGVTVDVITEVNGIADPNVIFPGEELEIPGLGHQETASGRTYTVQPGDTLSGIASQHGVSVADLQAANGLADADLIFPAQTLTIPGRESAPDDTPDLVLSVPPSDPFVEGFIEEACDVYDVDVGLAKALSWIESGWQQGAVSSTGALGVFQIMPETADFMEADVFGFELNEDVSVNDNVFMGVRLLHILVEAYGGDVDKAIASYYQGHGATSAGILYEDTVHYVAAVKAVWQRYWQ